MVEDISTEGVYVDLDDLARLREASRGLSFGPRQKVGSILSGRHASRLRGRGLSFEELRGYRPGDDVRAMDWRATARTQKPQVRVYSEERERPTFLVVDQRQSMFFGSQRDMKSVSAARAAALVAWCVAGAGDRIGGLVFNDNDSKFVSASRSQANVQRLLGVIHQYNRALPLKKATPGSGRSLNSALRRVSKMVTHDGLVVIISDLHDSGPETREIITRLRRHNDVLLCTIEDPMEHELPVGGDLVVSDGERQIPLDTTVPEIRAAFREARTRWLENINHLGLKYDVPRIPLRTDSAVETQLRAWLTRGQRGAG